MGEDIRRQLNLPNLDQVGFVVRDLQSALALYEPLFGPFSTMDPGPMTYILGERGVQAPAAVEEVAAPKKPAKRRAPAGK